MGTVETTMAPVRNLVDQVAEAQLRLPEIQRAYVWTRTQVRDLLDSLYRGYPVGTVLIWETDEELRSRTVEAPVSTRSSSSSNGGRFLLDGQQRLTSLAKVFVTREVDIRFNIETEEFQVANAAVCSDPRFVPVSDVFQKGAVSVALERDLLSRPDRELILSRLNKLERIADYPVPVHVLKGFDYEEVTDIFVRVNSKGTRLREAELAIARLAFRLPGMVTDELGAFRDRLAIANFDIELRFLVRALTAVATGQSGFRQLAFVPEETLREAWRKTRRALEYFLNLLRQNLGIESADWLPSLNAIVVPVAYLARHDDPREADTVGLLRWFVLASTWQRYAGAAETAMDQDLRALESPEPFRVLEEHLVQAVGRTTVSADDLDDAGSTSSFFLPMFLACRHRGAVDWWTGVRLSSTNLGTDHLLELHHIFPKALVKHRYPKRDVNELANLAFLSRRANAEISAKEPIEYLSQIAEERLTTQFVPLDRELWKVDRFQDFLAARRALLARGINEFLSSLR
ncbi:hypothetical protein HRbin29_00545 [bacterium HR29]|jgi:hypothetical protein|nr:hypothetical protein HRbin29_00545 [bacterium HR29]